MTQRLLNRRHLFKFAAATGWIASIGMATAATALPDVIAYRDPGCGCCEKWAEAMTAAGFKVAMSDDAELAKRRALLGVPQDLAGCHMALIGSYVIEGHVPPEDIKRLLTQKPSAMGLAVPGMPIGSPGMEMEGRTDHYDVVQFSSTGERKVFQSY